MHSRTPSNSAVGAKVALFTAGLLITVVACERRPLTRVSDASANAVSTTEVTSAEIARSDDRARVDRPEEAKGLVELAIEGEPSSFAVGAKTGASPRIVYLHGMCSGSRETLQSFERTAREHGGVLGLTGDKECPNGDHSFTIDPELQQRRIEQALATAGGGRRPPEVVIGYSLGATLAEKLAAAHGYPFVVLIGAPREPAPENLERARAVVMISGENDMAKPKMKAARAACDAAGIPAHYIEMPGARHGELPEADAVIGEALTWMQAHARPAPSSGGGP